MVNKKKKKLTITQFFLIYILILAAILLGVSSCNAALNSGNMEKVNKEPSSQGDDKTTQPTPVTGVQSDVKEDSSLPLSGLTVVIDAGHQENPPAGQEPYMPWDQSQTKAKNTHGTTGTATKKAEYVVNLEIALKIRDSLQEQGAKVILTRDNHETSLSNQDRAKIASDSNAHLAISIHCNSSGSSSVSGVETYSRGAGDGSAEYKARSEKDARIAQGLIDAVCNSTGATNRGAKTSDYYTGINYSSIPFIILECGFMSNPQEDKSLCDANYQQRIADGVFNYLRDNKASLVA